MSNGDSYRYDLGECNIVEPGDITGERFVPEHIVKPPYYHIYHPPCDTSGDAEVKHFDAIQRMRESCRLAANILKKCEPLCQVGITTDEIDKFVHDAAITAGAYPSPLRYADFPKSVCTSVNNIACHGIPDDRPLQDGDIINVDVTVGL